MITLFSYPDLFGLEDNNPYGLKVFAFLRLCGLPFAHRHILDTSAAPRGQLPYIVDGAQTVGDSDAIIAYLTRTHGLSIDAGLTDFQRDLDLLVRRALDDLYWVMSYSRWKDPRFWPAFRDALVATHPALALADLEAARQYNAERYRYQGIGRFQPEEVYARGIADLTTISDMIGDEGFLFGMQPTSIDAAIYGSVANIYFYAIDTPLRQCVMSLPNLVRHCRALRAAMGQGAGPGT